MCSVETFYWKDKHVYISVSIVYHWFSRYFRFPIHWFVVKSIKYFPHEAFTYSVRPTIRLSWVKTEQIRPVDPSTASGSQVLLCWAQLWSKQQTGPSRIQTGQWFCSHEQLTHLSANLRNMTDPSVQNHTEQNFWMKQPSDVDTNCPVVLSGRS